MSQPRAVGQKDQPKGLPEALAMVPNHIDLGRVAASTIIGLRTATRRIVAGKAYRNHAAVQAAANDKIARACLCEARNHCAEFDVGTGTSRPFDCQMVLNFSSNQSKNWPAKTYPCFPRLSYSPTDTASTAMNTSFRSANCSFNLEIGLKVLP